MKELNFQYQKNDFSKIEMKNNICINVFCYENKLTFPVNISDQKFENSMDLLVIFDGDKSHYVYIKDFDSSCFKKQKIKIKNTLEKLFTVLIMKMYWPNIKSLFKNKW